MELLEKMRWIEKVPEATDYDVDDSFYNECNEEPVTAEYSEGCSADTLIEDVYTQNNVFDKTHSIFKIEELMNSLPKEMLMETKRASVLAILDSFGLTANEVLDDGENRIKILDSVKNQLNIDSENLIANKQSETEEHKKAIAILETDISKNIDNTKQSNEVIETEIKRITMLIDFMGGVK